VKKIPAEIVRSLAAIFRGLSLVRQAAGRWTILWALLLLLQGLVPALLVYLSKVAVDAIATTTKSSSGGFSDFASLWPIILLISFLWFAGQVIASFATRVRLVQSELVQDHIHGLIHEKALSLDIAFFDSPSSYDTLHRARIDAISQPLAMLESIGSVMQNGVTLVALAVMLAAYTLWLPLLLIATAIPGLWVMGRHILREHRWRLENTRNERRSRYYDHVLTDQRTAQELRLFALGGHFRSLFTRIRAELRSGRLELAKYEMRSELAAGALSWVGGVAGMFWMVLRVVNGIGRLGDLVLCYQAFQQGQKLMRSLFESAGRIYRSTLFLDSLFQFLEAAPLLTSPDRPLPPPERVVDGIRFEEVTFAYPDSERTALRNFNLAVKGGKITAIVGDNGAGKSTLIKLLCRYYDPDCGRLTIDGTDLRSFSADELRRRMTVLFQEPVYFHATAAENIIMGDLQAAADDLKVVAAASDAGADVPLSRLPGGYATMLGKWFGGCELSVGEWQRVALARAFFRNAPIVILDEPTSAMDSWAENEWIARFRARMTGKTALIITHRFTTAMHADIIHVMQGGEVTESGTHQELVAAGGHYAASWQRQLQEVQNG